MKSRVDQTARIKPRKPKLRRQNAMTLFLAPKPQPQPQPQPQPLVLTLDDEPSPLNYDDLDRLKDGGDYFGYRVCKNGAYIQFTLLEEVDGLLQPIRLKPTGWKWHASLKKNDKNDSVRQACEYLLIAFFIKRAPAFKVLLPSALHSSSRDMYTGKQVTLYLNDNRFSECDLHSFCKDSEEGLLLRGCEPGRIYPANKMITGSQFFSRRNDTHPETGNYIADVDAEIYAKGDSELGLQAYNLNEEADPFENIDITKNYYKFSI